MTQKQPLTREIIYHGSQQSQAKPIQLTAGPLELLYEQGSLRYIKLGDFEIIRMIYSALRDANWGTIPAQISGERINQGKAGFDITYKADYKQGDINFRAQYHISGDEKGNIVFSLEGEALSDFEKNRLGFCLLHPVFECAGKPCQVVNTANKTISGEFPRYISPDQPLQDMKAIKWQINNDLKAIVEFEGDVFEMEDQRNWTDDSFKTYCTPLDIPFPAQVKKGEKFSQVIKLKFSGMLQKIKKETQGLIFELDTTKTTPIPAIGVGKSTWSENYSAREIELLQDIKFSHYRVDVKMDQPGWQHYFSTAIKEAGDLFYPLEIGLFLSDPVNQQVQDFIAFCHKAAPEIRFISIYPVKEKAASQSLLDQCLAPLKEAFPHTLIGAGTDAFFTELNRSRTPTDQIDYLAYSINPQVHHFDDASLVETLKAQEYTVESARQFAGNANIHVSPLTFKMRWNPNATGPEPVTPEGELPRQVDSRQMSLFGAGWTMGSLKYLIRSGASSITYFETVGPRGLFMGEKDSEVPQKFPADAYSLFPLYYLFKKLLDGQDWQLVSGQSNQDLVFDGMAMIRGDRMRVFLANFTDQFQQVRINRQETYEKAGWISLDEDTFFDLWKGNFNLDIQLTSLGQQELVLNMKPYALIMLEFKKQ
ncbi:MAG: hypothetical protein ACNS62_03725 [Candidatus Cyclobacteriaceae bacterium M3_2C_046]